MQIILQADVKALGKKGQVLDVSDGYARNFLIPKGLALEATSTNINILKTKAHAQEVKKGQELEKAKELCGKINDKVLIFKMKAGENGKLFGSITSKEIADTIKKQFGFTIDKKKINMEDALKTLGSANITVKIHEGVSASMTVKIEEEK
jgi:large subunit ribosomal protein L9